MMKLEPIIDVLQGHVSELMSLNGVECVGQGECKGSPCITLFVSVPSEQIRSLVPDSIEGYKVVINESGMFSAL